MKPYRTRGYLNKISEEMGPTSHRNNGRTDEVRVRANGRDVCTSNLCISDRTHCVRKNVTEKVIHRDVPESKKVDYRRIFSSLVCS